MRKTGTVLLLVIAMLCPSPAEGEDGSHGNRLDRLSPLKLFLEGRKEFKTGNYQRALDLLMRLRTKYTRHPLAGRVSGMIITAAEKINPDGTISCGPYVAPLDQPVEDASWRMFTSSKHGSKNCEELRVFSPRKHADCITFQLLKARKLDKRKLQWLIKLYLKSGDVTGAIVLLRNANSTRSSLRLADLYAQIGRFGRAIMTFRQTYKRIAKRRPGQNGKMIPNRFAEYALRNLASLTLTIGQVDKAERWYTEYLKNFPFSSGSRAAMWNMARIMWMKKRWRRLLNRMRTYQQYWGNRDSAKRRFLVRLKIAVAHHHLGRRESARQKLMLLQMELARLPGPVRLSASRLFNATVAPLGVLATGRGKEILEILPGPALP